MKLKYQQKSGWYNNKDKTNEQRENKLTKNPFKGGTSDVMNIVVGNRHNDLY